MQISNSKRHNKTALYVHLVWTTWDRLPLITADIEPDVYRLLQSEVEKTGSKVLAINGIADHVHILVELAATISVADFAKRLKGVSSPRINESHELDIKFKWQASYSAFTVSRWDVTKIVGYIQGQKEHHSEGTWITSLEPDD